MAKTKLTLQLEKDIYKETKKMSVFSCFEVTIGFGGSERVDYMTYDTKGIWRCYEIKVSKQDFYSKAKLSFVGHYNYFVMPRELYEKVKQDIPKDIGVYCGANLIKKPKKQKLKIEEDVLKNSMIRSLSREFDKYMENSDTEYIANLKSQINNLKRMSDRNYEESLAMRNGIYEICEKYNLNYNDIRKIIRKNI